MKTINDPCENCDGVLQCKDCHVFKKLHYEHKEKLTKLNNPNLCCICHSNYVDSANGFDTCDRCLKSI